MPFNLVNLTLKQKIDAIEASKNPGFSQVEGRKQTKISDFFKNNVIDNNDAIFCDCDEDQIASHFCKSCSSEEHTEFLCKKCVEAHKRVRFTHSHTIISIDNSILSALK